MKLITVLLALAGHLAAGWRRSSAGGVHTRLSHKRAGTFRAKIAAVNQEQPDFPGPHGDLETGLALSGGGIRATAWAMGVLRGLNNLDLLGRVDAISSVSGGTWAAAPFMFAAMDPTELLGHPTQPEQLTLEVLSARDGRLTDVVNGSASAVFDGYRAIYPGNEAWERTVADVFLQPFNLGDRGLYMAANANHVSQICAANPQFVPEQFVVPRPDRPKSFIMNGILAAPPGCATDRSKLVALQMSPDYTGSPFWPDYTAGSLGRINYTALDGESEIKDVARGGGMVETFAFGGQAPMDSQSGSRTVDVVPPDQPFSLPLAVAISSSMRNWAHRAVWPVLPQGFANEPAITHELGDQGIIENSGLLALLQRRVSKAVAVMSTSIALDVSVDLCAPRSEAEWAEIIEPCGKVGCTLTALFGYTYVDSVYDYSKDQVFARDDLPAVLCELQTLKAAGSPTVTLKTFRVLRNAWWGIDGGFDVRLLIVYLDKCSDFEASLATDTREALETDGRFAPHPAYATGSYLEHPITSLLAAQSEYFVHQNERFFRELLGSGAVSSLSTGMMIAMLVMLPLHW